MSEDQFLRKVFYDTTDNQTNGGEGGRGGMTGHGSIPNSF